MTEFSKETLTEEEAFWVMFYFLEGHYEISGGQFDISDILSASQPFEFDKNGHFDGKVEGNRKISVADSGMIWHWNEAVKKFRQQGIPKPKALKK
jgi:cobyric acid synthase